MIIVPIPNVVASLSTEAQTGIDVTTALECQTTASANGTLYLDTEMESGVTTDISANGTLYMDVESENRCDTEIAVNGTLYLDVETNCGCRSVVKGNKKIKSKSHTTHVSVSVGI